MKFIPSPARKRDIIFAIALTADLPKNSTILSQRFNIIQARKIFKMSDKNVMGYP